MIDASFEAPQRLLQFATFFRQRFTGGDQVAEVQASHQLRRRPCLASLSQRQPGAPLDPPCLSADRRNPDLFRLIRLTDQLVA